jgi:hypothetical protein
MMVLQPIFGYLHHMHFVKNRSRGPISYIHIFYGRIVMLLGVINGGLGLRLASESNNLVIAYAVVAAIIGVVYIAVKLLTAFRKPRNDAPRALSSSDSSAANAYRQKEANGGDVELRNRSARA